MKQPARRKRRAKGGDDGGTVPPDKNDFFKKRTLKMHTIVATDEAEEDVTIMPSFAGWTFACLGLSAAEETKVREIVRLHRGRMDDGRLDGGRRHLCRYSTCSHVVTGYWLPVTIEADDSAVYVTLHWLEQVHATTQNLPLDSSILFQPPPFHRHSFHLAYPHEYIITDSFDPAMHVELPCVPSSKLCFDIPRWPYVVALLTRPIPDVDALEHVIHLITGQQGTRLRCLRRAIDEYVEDATTLFTVTLPYMVSTALALPLLFPSPVPLLTRQVPSSVTLTKRQAACLIIHAFLCTFTAANTSFNHFHFFDVFAPSAPPDWSNAATTDQDATAVQKLVTVLHYFSRFTTDNLCDNTNHRYDQQVITYARHVLDTTTPSTDSGMAGDSGGWADTLPWTSVHVHANGAIEDDVGAVQVDFANKFAGGGVLGHGCVQEEIRFLMNPECLVACLLTEVLDPTECFVISGTEQYAASSGYGSTFAFAGGVLDLVPVDVNMMRDTVIVGIDATKYYRNNAWHQFRPEVHSSPSSI
ncbi:hypothetical protein, variant 5 [Aphanomyces astaci]|uniref:poly(ADP-ribose) glycohydrolase n=1 Tax=Aphanomyces astaci TaxID=112090 RepID=W4GYX1_APHAT|nr:hypothetical protein, variant 5 [Aphanomyces astaci]ETV84862.1 hypothetical protein, variant 5 [Aphanomyces astaci]|eukprot:XP_009826554.1 hypothetical protein, variant 5 [Aphanomyces astaci]